MRKISTLILPVALTAALVSCRAGCPTEGVQYEAERLSATYIQSTPRAMDMGFIADHYLSQMISAVAQGDDSRANNLAQYRNEIIDVLVLPEQKITVQQLKDNFYHYAGFSLDRDYIHEMMLCCTVCDLEGGRQLASEWNKKIAADGSGSSAIDFDELLWLAKGIEGEAGSSWLSVEWKMMTGEVLVNRVASPEFPDTVYDCLHQDGQYSGADKGKFKNITPSEASAEAAVRLMLGERLLNDQSVVFQANFPQGSGVCKKLYDSRLGYTYLCYSNRPELYEEVVL